MDTWSTDAVSARNGFSYWREVVCRTILNVTTESPHGRFRARMSGRTFGTLRFAAFQATSYETIRTRKHVERAPEAHYIVSLQRRGQSWIVQDDAALSLNPGEIAIVDGQQPFRIGFPGPVSRVVAVVPHEMIDTRAPWLRKACRKIAPSSPFVGLARRHLLQLTVGRDSLEQGEAKLLTDNLCNLLTVASAQDTAARVRPPELQLAALLAFVRQNLGSPELSPRMVAARFGISVRTLHLRFESVGQTFGRFVLDSRLDGCGKALRDSRQVGCSISVLAYSWGFNDLSHFNKAFRARFDMAPGEWRHSSQSTQR